MKRCEAKMYEIQKRRYNYSYLQLIKAGQWLVWSHYVVIMVTLQTLETL